MFSKDYSKASLLNSMNLTGMKNILGNSLHFWKNIT